MCFFISNLNRKSLPPAVSSMAGTWELNGVPTLIELDSIDSLNARCMSASLQSPMAMFNGNPNPSSVVPHIEE